MIGYIIWDVSPEIFTIGSFSLRWYGLLFAATFFFGYLILKRFIKMDGLSIKVLDSWLCIFYRYSYRGSAWTLFLLRS